MPQAIVNTSSESLPSPARSAPMRLARFGAPKSRFVGGVVPRHVTFSNADVEPRLAGDVLSGLPKSCHSAGGACGTRPSAGRVFHVTEPSAQESSGTKLAWCSGSPSNAYPVKLFSRSVAPVIVAPAGIEERLKRSRPYDGPVPQP